MYIDIYETVKVAVRKAMEQKGVSMSEEEFEEFWKNLQRDPQFLIAYKNSIRME